MPHADPLRDLGVRLTPDGGQLRVWSAHATAIELCILDAKSDWIAERVPLAPDDGGVWSVMTPALAAGTRYALSVDGPEGPTHAFDPERLLLDPYARGLAAAPRVPGVPWWRRRTSTGARSPNPARRWIAR